MWPFRRKPALLTQASQARAEALKAYDQAVRRGDTRDAHHRHAEARRLTHEALRLEVGR